MSSPKQGKAAVEVHYVYALSREAALPGQLTLEQVARYAGSKPRRRPAA